jgi:hypothetical protein
MKWHWFKKHEPRHPITFLVAIFLLAMAFLIAFLIYIQGTVRRDVEFGVTFSWVYAEELGLDPKVVFTELLDDLGVRKFRIPVYWNQTEPVRDKYVFDDYDWLIREAAKREAEVILVLGRRVPRWPECFYPLWLTGESEITQRDRVLSMLQVSIDHFRPYRNIIMWQVENEPLLDIFGECPKSSKSFLKDEVSLVQQLDPSRPVMVTDSGELSSWLEVAEVADILGVSMYRVTWNNWLGYWYYPLPPTFYRAKANVVRGLVNEVVITELQAEPWSDGPIIDFPLAEQYRSMNALRFRNNVNFAKRTGFAESYLWGAEWWYWLKFEKGDDSMWQEARKVWRN